MDEVSKTFTTKLGSKNTRWWKKNNHNIYYFTNNASQKHASTYSIGMYWTIFWQTTVLIQENIFFKLLQNYPLSLRFFWHLLRLNWSIFRDRVSLWRMLEHQEIAVFEGKCHRFVLELTVPQIIDKFWSKRCQKKRKDMDYKLLQIFCCTWAVGCWKFVQYIRMLYPGRFILVESVVYSAHEIGL